MKFGAGNSSLALGFYGGPLFPDGLTFRRIRFPQRPERGASVARRIYSTKRHNHSRGSAFLEKAPPRDPFEER